MNSYQEISIKHARSAGALLILLISLSSCHTASRTTSPAVSNLGSGGTAAVAIDTPVATVSSTEPGPPNSTLFLTVTPTGGPTPSFELVNIGDDFLFGEENPCRLPCWHGLKINQSGKEDIKHVFDTSFGFHGSRDVFIYNSMPAESGLLLVRNVWTTDADNGESFEVLVYVDNAEFILKKLAFSWTSKKYGTYVNPERIISELGRPSQMSADISTTQDENFVVLDMAMTYEKPGLKFEFRYGLEASKDVGTKRLLIPFCLDQNGMFGKVWISQPASSSDTQLQGSRSWEVQFDTNIDSLTQRVHQGERVCTTATINAN